MCDNKNEIRKSDHCESMDNASTRLDLDITETTDSYPEFDFLDLLRNLQVKEKKAKHRSSKEELTNKSNPFSEEDSDIEALAKLYEEKYGTCNDYAELGEGYDEEDSFIDNSDAVNDLVPSGIQTEFGGFYINRGKLNFVKEDNSSSSTSEDVDKFLALNRLNTRKISTDDENDEKEYHNKSQSNNHGTVNPVGSNITNSINSSTNNNNNSGSHNNNNNQFGNSNNNNSSLHSNIIKNRKKLGENQQHKSKKIRKTATPKIPDHLLYKKPFPGSFEYRKNINEFKKNRLKNVESDKKTVPDSVVNSSTSGNINSNNNNNNNGDNNNGNNSHINSISIVNSSCNNNCSEDDNEKESFVAKKKPVTVKELLKERDGALEVIEAVATGTDVAAEKQYSSSSGDSSESSSSESESDSSEYNSNEKEKTPQRKFPEGGSQQKNSGVGAAGATVNGFISPGKDITAKSFAHLSDGLKELVAKLIEISKEEKNKFFNSKLNALLLSLDERLRELPMAERNSVLDQVAEILQMKRDNITKRTKKLLVLQEESKMSAPLRKLKELVSTMMPLLESNYFNEYTKAAGTSPQIYAELSRYYWSIDPGSLPQRKFPWNDETRHLLREIVQYRKNCYYIIRPRKESLIDYLRNFMETKVKCFWPKEWMTVEILLEEGQVTSQRSSEESPKAITKILGNQNQPQNSQKKISSNASNVLHRKPSSASVSGQASSLPANSSTTTTTNRKSNQGMSGKNPEVKSILIPRKTPHVTSGSGPPSKSAISSVSSLQVNSVKGSRLQVTLNRLNVQDYLDRISGSQTSISRNPGQQQTSQNRIQKSVSPSRLVKTSSPNSVLNPTAIRSNAVPTKNVSPTNSTNKSGSSGMRNNGNQQQSVLKTIEIHSNPISGSKTSPNSVTISPVNESVFRDMTPSAEVLNLTKNSSVYISKVKDSTDSKVGAGAGGGRSNSPSIGIPLPSGITISPTTNSSPSTFLAKPQQKQQQQSSDRNSDVKINVSITKQEAAAAAAAAAAMMMGSTKEKRESVLNVKREGPLQNIPDCISVTSKVMSNERHKYEHVRKRALQEYHQQQQQQQQKQQSPEKFRPEEKKLKMAEEAHPLVDVEMKEERLDDKNFSKIFDSVIAKTSETVRLSESVGQTKLERFGGDGSGSNKNPGLGVTQLVKNNLGKSRDVRTSKEKLYYSGVKSESNANASVIKLSEDKRLMEDLEERNENMKEQRVQMEMDRVMQNLVELSREKNSDYTEFETRHLGAGYHTNPSGMKHSAFQEAYQKMFK